MYNVTGDVGCCEVHSITLIYNKILNGFYICIDVEKKWNSTYHISPRTFSTHSSRKKNYSIQ